jgi:hypothetical protein
MRGTREIMDGAPVDARPGGSMFAMVSWESLNKSRYSHFYSVGFLNDQIHSIQSQI